MRQCPSADWGTTYNLLGEVTGTSGPDTGNTSMSYDAGGNLTSTTDADGHTISYAYDALSRKTAEYDGATSPQIASWVYDNSNNVAGVTDPIGQLTTETSYSGGNPYTIQQKAFNVVFGESTGETLTLIAATPSATGTPPARPGQHLGFSRAIRRQADPDHRERQRLRGPEAARRAPRGVV